MQHPPQRGRELGYPTANLSPEVEGFIPADGVYAAWLVVDGQRYGAAVSIGNNPTFDPALLKSPAAKALEANAYVVSSIAPFNLDKPAVQRMRAVGDGLGNPEEIDNLLDIPAFLRRQAD